MSKKDVNSTKVTSKIRSSLVIKLNVKMIGRLVSGFLAINILIFLMSFFVILWKTEEGAQDIIEQFPKELGTINHGDSYQVLMTKKPTKGITLPSKIQESLPLKVHNAKRNIVISQKGKNIKLLDKVYSLKYIIGFSISNSFYKIVYSLGSDLELFLHLFLIILIFEALILIGDIGKGSKMIRKTLKPLSDLTETARSLMRR